MCSAIWPCGWWKPLRANHLRLGDIVQVMGLHSTAGMMCGPEAIEARRYGARGSILKIDTCLNAIALVWVQHGQTTAPYWNYEVTLIGQLVGP